MTHPVEFAVFAFFTVTVIGLGLALSFKRIGRLTTEEMFLGSRTLRMIPLALSALASVMSSTGIIAFSAHFYAYGLHMGWTASVATLLLIPFTIHVDIPVLYRLKITSVFEDFCILKDRRAVAVTDAYCEMSCRFPEKWLFNALCYQILVLQVCDGGLYGSVFELPVRFDSRGRIVSRNSASAASASRRTAGVGMTLFSLSYVSLTGMGILLIYWFRDCDPLLSGSIEQLDQDLVLSVVLDDFIYVVQDDVEDDVLEDDFKDI
ncbi:hypothetical protein HPB47_020955 [Ixodes persulcatus]|uniref:Uncharacterized protein n=1 Tax=Ixodes persulcatus TaxID=34615 RepID=A0AC60QHH0_IXOPE|nr:hypothetical protein HPB47_020955 [Ixodes persulcatus]